MEHIINRVQLKNTILAVAHQILSTCSEEKLEMAVAALICGDPITLKPHKPVILEDYEYLIQKIERAMTYRPMRRRQPKPEPIDKTGDYPNLFTVTVPMEMDVSKLSDLERQILYQNLDKMLLVTMHPPLKRTKECAKVRAKIGIAVRHLWSEQKQALGIKEDYIKERNIEFYKEDMCILGIIFMPMLHHFYKALNTRMDVFGVPP